MASRAAILATGLATPVGFGTEQTLASLEAGVAGFRGAAVVDKRFEEFTMALVPEEELPPLEEEPELEPAATARQRRMLRLGAIALAEVLGDDELAATTPVFLAGPEPVADRAGAASPEWLAALSKTADVEFDRSGSQIFAAGRAGGFLALQAALHAIESGTVQRAVVGGVDTFLDLYLLATLDAEGRIQTPSEMDGFIPGEGAAFVLLGAPANHPEALAHVHGVGNALEPGHRGSDEPYLGDGLAAAATTALGSAALPGGELVETIYAGHNGESFGHKEWGVTFTRNQAQMNPEGPVHLPAESVGDAGAAMAPLMMAMAAHGLAKQEVAGPCLVWASADGPERGVAILHST